MSNRKPSHTLEVKKEAVEAWLSGKKTLEQIQKELDLYQPHQILRWKDALEKRGVSFITRPQTGSVTTAIVADRPKNTRRSDVKADSKDLIIDKLQKQIGQLILKIIQLEAKYGHSESEHVSLL